MIAARRAARARHEFRLGTRELVILGVVAVLVSGLTFALGVLVGRETGARPRVAAPAVDPLLAGRDHGGKPAPAQAEEKLTFYRTLTAPTPDLPVVGKGALPVVEERLIPREEAAATGEGESGKTAARDRPPGSPTAARSRPPAPLRPAAPARPAAMAAVAPPGAGGAEPQLWTIQVSSFRSRALAEELRARLQTRGLDAYLLSAATEEGRVRYRVRVGSYQSRTEAERVAGELRNERTLSPFVTPRSR